MKSNIIADGVKIGIGTLLKHFIELRKGTVIGDFCYIDSRVSTSGDCVIRDRVTLRYGVIIARCVIIESDVFIAPNVMTENLNHRGEAIGGAHIGIGEWDRETTYRVFVGTNAIIAAGIKICSGVVIGRFSNVRKDILEPGVYAGNPLRRLR